ncbi:MAG: peptidoglycan DD-metalloendopeptidase family protein [Ginsengibacter sp.]
MHFPEDLLYERLQAHSHTFHQVVDFNPSKEKLIKIDFTEENNELKNVDISDSEALAAYINKMQKAAKAKFVIGGYNENRTLYKGHDLFKGSSSKLSSSPPVEKGTGDEARTIHLGIDIWGEEGTKVYAPIGGLVHSFAYNNNYGDYGATIILMHQLDTFIFYTLYGHLSLADIAKVSEFQYIIRGHVIGHFGSPEENGHWPPHLHFQVIKDLRTYKGDYPGVCTSAERKKYLVNCPDPDSILNMTQFLV